VSLALGCVAENTPKYLAQAVRLVQSIRWFGGALSSAKLYVCVVEDIRQDFRDELERYGVTIRVVPRFSTRHPQSNKLRFLQLEELALHERVLLLDCDTIVVRDPSCALFRADFVAKIADVPTVPMDTFRRIFAAFGLPMPQADQRCTVRGEPAIPYFNAGVLAFSRRGMDVLVPKWIELNEQLIASMELLEGHENFCEQASLSLALAATGTTFEAVGNAFNFPMHFDDQATAPGLADTEPFIVHYHWLADPSGYILPSVFPAVKKRVDQFNARLRQERESRFDNQLFWNQRYAENPELGSGVGSRGEARDYKRDLLKEAAARWAPASTLDVGCGDLEVGSALPADGYTGLDVSEVVVAANREKFADRIFVAGNFLEMELASADMLVCLDVLIHLASPDDYRHFVRKLVRSARKVGIVAGDEIDPGLAGIVFFHEPLSRTLADAGARNVRKIGSYRHVTIFEFTPPQIEQEAIVVLGMHRSGTSALAAVISMLGITPGNNLQPPIADVNSKGFWEHADIVALHEQVLGKLGSSWHDERPLPDQAWNSPDVVQLRRKIVDILRRDFSSEPMWLIKDPRMCRLLPLWQHVFRELACPAKFILVLRHPGEVASSLLKRDGLPEARACLLWLTHMLEAEYQTRGQHRMFVSYSRLLEEPQQTVAAIREDLGIDGPVSAEAAASINAFLDPTLRHHAGRTELPEHPACRLALKGFELLSAPQPEPSSLDQLRAEVMQLVAVVAPWSGQLQLVDRQNIDLRSANASIDLTNAGLRTEVARIKSTASWQMTKPLRLVWNALSRVLRPNPP